MLAISVVRESTSSWPNTYLFCFLWHLLWQFSIHFQLLFLKRFVSFPTCPMFLLIYRWHLWLWFLTLLYRKKDSFFVVNVLYLWYSEDRRRKGKREDITTEKISTAKNYVMLQCQHTHSHKQREPQRERIYSFSVSLGKKKPTANCDKDACFFISSFPLRINFFHFFSLPFLFLIILIHNMAVTSRLADIAQKSAVVLLAGTTGKSINCFMGVQ